MNRTLNHYFLSLLILAIFIGGRSLGAVRLPAIFGDNMVLQAGRHVPVWGLSEPGEQVKITFMGRVFKTKADDSGHWHLKLGSYVPGGPYKMVVAGNDGQKLFTNVLIGEVWVASGQSNMEMGIGNEKDCKKAIENARDTLIHLFTVPIATALEPQPDVDKANTNPLVGKWIVCSPQNIVYDHAPWTGFSAIGYEFAVHIRNITHSPVGIIGTYKGGTPAQAWISTAGLKQVPELSKYVALRQGYIDNLESVKASYPERMVAYKADFDQWNEAYGREYNAALKQWLADKAKGIILSPKPKLAKPAPTLPIPPDGGFSGPSNLYNAMLNPILGYGIKGVIWYQGENNGDWLTGAVGYKLLFNTLIKDWRKQWQQNDLPFLFVQLANFRDPAVLPSEGNWPWVRDGQTAALKLPHTAMAVAIDIGDADNIHPTDKQDVALRLALAARHEVYKQNVVFSGPQYRRMEIVGNTIKLTFDKLSPLVIGNKSKSGDTTSTKLKGFGIAGADHHFYWAKATLMGNTVTFVSDQVAQPLAVRYDWADNPPGNLYNQAGLPASPFRTDDWIEPLTVN